MRKRRDVEFDNDDDNDRVRNVTECSSGRSECSAHRVDFFDVSENHRPEEACCLNYVIKTLLTEECWMLDLERFMMTM